MKEIVELMQAQLELFDDSLIKLDSLKQTLKTSPDGSEVGADVKELESLLTEFANLEAWQDEILYSRGADSIADLLAAFPPSDQTDEAWRLFGEVQDKELELKAKISSANELLSRSRNFIDYTINVMSRARADGAYGPPGAPAGGVRDRQIFDANI
jgi:hypothetical protein